MNTKNNVLQFQRKEANIRNNVTEIDLNELLFDHPAANFVFRLKGEYLIVDRALVPSNGSLVLIDKGPDGYAVEAYHGQPIWGVITYQIKDLRSQRREASA